MHFNFFIDTHFLNHRLYFDFTLFVIFLLPFIVFIVNVENLDLEVLGSQVYPLRHQCPDVFFILHSCILYGCDTTFTGHFDVVAGCCPVPFNFTPCQNICADLNICSQILSLGQLDGTVFRLQRKLGICRNNNELAICRIS